MATLGEVFAKVLIPFDHLTAKPDDQKERAA